MKHALSALFFFFLLAVLVDCTNETAQSDTDASGAQLARVRCGSCHQYPEPDLLPKATWQQYVLPRMGYLLGVYDADNPRATLIESGPGGEAVRKANTYPEEPQISADDWEAIQAFYLNNAPDQLPKPGLPALDTNLLLFEAVYPELRLSPPSATLVDIGRQGGLFLGDANTKAFYQLDPNLQLQQAAQVREGAVALTEFPNQLLLTVMGSFSPTDAASGFLMALPKQTNQSPQVLIPNLQRPVHTAVGDLDNDQRPDFVISEFAKWTGRLAYWTLVDGQYQPTVLRNAPGAIRSVLVDWNQDGRDDVVALFGQGAEGIYVFYNRGDGRFKEERILEFPSSYGSSYFDLVDLDRDGDFDILYTNGDNADYPPILKPYHGIRFFTNDGNNQFSETFFYPLAGAYKAIPGDFDADGDFDLAAISFFPDFAGQPERSFVYLENQGNGQYQTKTFPGSTNGRWITMDAGDLDRDGDLDIVLGSLAFEVVPSTGILNQWVASGLPFVVLENQLK